MISHKYRFIYTKISKCGSTSVESALTTLDQTGGEHTGHWHILDDINQHTKNYFKFTMVRNPWDRLVSFFTYATEGGRFQSSNYNKNSSFKDFVVDNTDKFFIDSDWTSHSPNLKRIISVSRLSNPRLEPQLDWITDGYGKVLTDFIGRIENFQEDFDVVCDKMGVARQQLPHINKTNHMHYTEYYDDETKEIVAEKYAKDIEYFGYEYK